MLFHCHLFPCGDHLVVTSGDAQCTNLRWSRAKTGSWLTWLGSLSFYLCLYASSHPVCIMCSLGYGSSPPWKQWNCQADGIWALKSQRKKSPLVLDGSLGSAPAAMSFPAVARTTSWPQSESLHDLQTDLCHSFPHSARSGGNHSCQKPSRIRVQFKSCLITIYY